VYNKHTNIQQLTQYWHLALGNVDGALQVQLEEDGSDSTRESWMESSGLWTMIHCDWHVKSCDWLSRLIIFYSLLFPFVWGQHHFHATLQVKSCVPYHLIYLEKNIPVNILTDFKSFNKLQHVMRHFATASTSRRAPNSLVHRTLHTDRLDQRHMTAKVVEPEV